MRSYTQARGNILRIGSSSFDQTVDTEDDEVKNGWALLKLMFLQIHKQEVKYKRSQYNIVIEGLQSNNRSMRKISAITCAIGITYSHKFRGTFMKEFQSKTNGDFVVVSKNRSCKTISFLWKSGFANSFEAKEGILLYYLEGKSKVQIKEEFDIGRLLCEKDLNDFPDPEIKTTWIKLFPGVRCDSISQASPLPIKNSEDSIKKKRIAVISVRNQQSEVKKSRKRALKTSTSLYEEELNQLSSPSPAKSKTKTNASLLQNPFAIKMAKGIYMLGSKLLDSSPGSPQLQKGFFLSKKPGSPSPSPPQLPALFSTVTPSPLPAQLIPSGRFVEGSEAGQWPSLRPASTSPSKTMKTAVLSGSRGDTPKRSMRAGASLLRGGVCGEGRGEEELTPPFSKTLTALHYNKYRSRSQQPHNNLAPIGQSQDRARWKRRKMTSPLDGEEVREEEIRELKRKTEMAKREFILQIKQG